MFLDRQSLKQKNSYFCIKFKTLKLSRFQHSNLLITFYDNEFDVCFSNDVVEHLPPEDAEEHLQQIFRVLKPGEKRIVIMPNRISGPHDVTRMEFPEVRKALGFHLNESTYREMKTIMRAIGFIRFRVLYKLKSPQQDNYPAIMPYQLGFASEILYRSLPKIFREGILQRLISIRLVAYTPERLMVTECH